MTIETPRDRNGTFEPLLIPKYERRLAGFDDKILALYAKGMSTRDIQELVKTLYDVELSPALISSVTDAVDEEVTAWRSRPLPASTRSSISTGSWCMCAAPVPAFCSTRSTWPWA